uniref:H/ACA ribonucleoprotein complex non-core subunit NAF1 n=1 Tax=Brassica campestris TaxID=3711 RepID=A0A3P6C0C9_BRACM|nr:unnamed protein product [Brassica rapa]
MAGFAVKPVKEEELPVEAAIDEDPKVKTFKDFPSIDSYLDFDSFNWLGSNNSNIEEFSLDDTDFGFFEEDMEIGQEGVTVSEETRTVMSESVEVTSKLCCGVSGVSSISSESMIDVKPLLCGGMSANFDGVAEPAVKEAEPVVSKDSGPMEDEKGETSSAESESETSSSSSSSSASSSSEEEEEESDEEESNKEKKFEDQMVMGEEDDMAEELEEGEIRSVDEEHEVEEDDVNEMVAWSNDEDEDLGWQTNEPLRTKNELKELPHVPPVDATLEPHHVMLPLGVVLSVMSTQVTVGGMEEHGPLAEGSILWITERRTPLGLVDEIFGQVECPLYSVRFNSENEVPEGVSEGTPVSYVADYAQHILNIKELQKKGYDASGDNDEEVSEELEFSDDEKEAQYRKTQKMEKRGMMDDQKDGNARNKKKKNNDLGTSTSNNDSREWTENRGSSSLSSNRSDPQMGGPVTNHQPRPRMEGFPPNGGGWRPQSNQQNSHQFPPMPSQMAIPNLPPPMQRPLMAMQNQMMFRPQFNGGQLRMPAGPGGLNFFQGQATAPWPALVGQNCFNQRPFGMGRGIQPPQFPMNPQFQMLNNRPQAPVNPQFPMQPQFPVNPQFQMRNNNRPQSPMNPQFPMQPQFPMNPQFQMRNNNRPQSPMNPYFQIRKGGRGHHGRGRDTGRGRFGHGRGRGRQQSG